MLDKGEIPDSTVRIVVCVFSYCIMPKIMHSFINFSAVPCTKTSQAAALTDVKWRVAELGLVKAIHGQVLSQYICTGCKISD